MAKTEKSSKKRVVKVDAIGKAYVNASFNNLIITLTNNAGQVISWSSAGKMGFKGSKKNTPYAAQMAAQDASRIQAANPVQGSDPLVFVGCREPGGVNGRPGHYALPELIGCDVRCGLRGLFHERAEAVRTE